MHKVIGFLLVLALVGGFVATLVALYPGPLDPEGDTSPVLVIIDADVPGTKVFRGAEELGVVPVNLTQSRLDALGIGHVAVNPATPLTPDPWGGTLHLGFGRDAPPEERLALQVPDAVADRYKAVETPWGRRTAPGGVAGGPRPTGLEIPKLRVQFAPAATADGLRFQVQAPGRVTGGNSFVVTLTAENIGTKPIAGTKPEFTLYAIDRNGTGRTLDHFDAAPLPAAWEKLAPGQKVKTSVEFAAPDRPGDYNLSAMLLLRAVPAENRKGASTLSNVELLQVK